jgi:hypothetical protein
MIARIDTWIGKALFVPIIIRLCQRLGCTQFRFNRVCWFLAALISFKNATDVVGQVAIGLIAVYFCLLAALVEEHKPATSWRWFRLTVVCLTILDVISRSAHLGTDFFVLFAEYAATIRTIPPLSAKEPSHLARLARTDA